MIRTTYLGKAIRATVQDGEAAMLMGIPVPRIFLITFAVGSALVGLAACVMMPLFSVFPTVGLNFVLIAFVIVVLGGMGSIEGALLGRHLHRRGAVGQQLLRRARLSGRCSSSSCSCW